MPKTNKLLLIDVLSSLDLLVNQKRKEFGETSYPTKLKILGVANPDLKKVLKEIKLATKDYSSIEKFNFALDLVQTEILECLLLAYEFLGSDKAALALFGESDLKKFDIGFDNWVIIDTYGSFILGVAWRNGQIKTDTIHKLTQHPDFWKRRLALVATVPLNLRSRGGKGDAAKTLAVCKLLVNDHQDMIVKALSWALRLLSHFHRTEVEEFMIEYDLQLHPRVKRELTNKLTTGLKNPH
ncbi:MAG: DNA alkylation repair protein [Bacteroidia bacterium]|nr:DNA alkylation repair protein [Bacteroidia bacterium]MCF8427650.1 DNA alkylation repair protein [Bacteroidia bacterium]